jgi:hypothetical protein
MPCERFVGSRGAINQEFGSLKQDGSILAGIGTFGDWGIPDQDLASCPMPLGLAVEKFALSSSRAPLP